MALESADAKLNRLVAAQLTKTKLCAMFLRASCVDAECRFAHSLNELRSAPDLFKTAMCRAALRGECRDEACKFAHSEQELRVTPSVYKTSLCNFFERGHCNKGDRCRHAHGVEELRDFEEKASKEKAMEDKQPRKKGPKEKPAKENSTQPESLERWAQPAASTPQRRLQQDDLLTPPVHRRTPPLRTPPMEPLPKVSEGLQMPGSNEDGQEVKNRRFHKRGEGRSPKGASAEGLYAQSPVYNQLADPMKVQLGSPPPLPFGAPALPFSMNRMNFGYGHHPGTMAAAAAAAAQAAAAEAVRVASEHQAAATAATAVALSLAAAANRSQEHERMMTSLAAMLQGVPPGLHVPGPPSPRRLGLSRGQLTWAAVV